MHRDRGKATLGVHGPEYHQGGHAYPSLVTGVHRLVTMTVRSMARATNSLAVTMP
jgi:hypothetical protein